MREITDEELHRIMRLMRESPELFTDAKPALYERIETWRKQFNAYGTKDSGDYRGDATSQYYLGMDSGLTIALQEIDRSRYRASVGASKIREIAAYFREENYRGHSADLLALADELESGASNPAQEGNG